MATFAEIEDLRDWIIDVCGEICAKVGEVNGEEPAEIITLMNANVVIVSEAMLSISRYLDQLLMFKKKSEYEA